MKIGIITLYRNLNYGATLQAFALIGFLSKNGHKVELIDYRRPKWEEIYNFKKFSFCKKIKYLAIHHLLHFDKNGRIINWTKERKFNHFISELPQTDKISSINELHKLQYDILISGSDQIWNPEIMGNKSNIDPYFLNFGKDNCIKISYASSIGSYQFTEPELEIIKLWLSSYRAISVRESYSKNQLQLKNISIVLDPTFLFSRSEWLRYSIPTKIKSNYVLVYAVGNENTCIEYAEIIAKRLNLKVINISTNIFKKKNVSYNIRDAGPKDFISLINNAKFIVTSSFHGMAFSVNFNKDFISVYDNKLSTRSQDFLARVNLTSRLIKSQDEARKIEIRINYNTVNLKMREMHKQSTDFLLKNIQIP